MDGVVAGANVVGLPYVVIGGFSVIDIMRGGKLPIDPIPGLDI